MQKALRLGVSALRSGVVEPTREDLDALSKADLCRVLAVLTKSSAAFGFEVALSSLDEGLRRGTLDGYSAQAVAARVAFEGLQALPASGPDLGAYDRALIGQAGGER